MLDVSINLLLAGRVASEPLDRIWGRYYRTTDPLAQINLS